MVNLAVDPQPSAMDPRCSLAWTVLASVEDPEIPAVSVVDLGLVRFIKPKLDGTLEVGLTLTYVGCPATDMIRDSVHAALRDAGVGRFVVTTVLSPAWSSDWITAEGRHKLELCGIVAPEGTASVHGVATRGMAMHGMARDHRPLACPRCQSTETECISEFGSTPCKALHRCRACLEPFEYFKCI